MVLSAWKKKCELLHANYYWPSQMIKKVSIFGKFAYLHYLCTLKMRIKSVIILLFAVIMVMLASTPRPSQHSVEREQSVPGNSIQKRPVIPDTVKYEAFATPDTTIIADSIMVDSIVVDSGDTSSLSSEIDTLSMDSLHLAIYHHNKAVDDSLRQDSLNRAKPNGIDSPVTFSASVSFSLCPY